MEFTNPNQFERVRKLEGIHSPEDIWDLETYDEIKEEVEQAKPNIREFVNESELDIETKRCLDKTRTFCTGTMGSATVL